MKFFEDPKDTPLPPKVETRDERKDRRKRERDEQVAYKLEQEIALWNPHNLCNGTVDAYKTLFVARINYDTTASKLRREFEVYGPIHKIALVHKAGKPKGYAFIEYEHERDMHSAYKKADGKKVDGRRVLVDVERGRTVKGWLPRKLGGGLGGTRRGGADVNLKHLGREDEREHHREEGRDWRSVTDSDRDRRRREKRRRSRTRSREHRRRPVDDGECDRKRRRSRERRKDKENRYRRDGESKKGIVDPEKVRIKPEPPDDYPDYANGYNSFEAVAVKEEKC